MTTNEYEEITKLCRLTIEDVRDLTAVVRDLVKTSKWSWPEFLEHELGYLALKARKKVAKTIRAKCES